MDNVYKSVDSLFKAILAVYESVEEKFLKLPLDQHIGDCVEKKRKEPARMLALPIMLLILPAVPTIR